MKWMKSSVGKTLKDAKIEWKRLCELKKDISYKVKIDPQFEYNRYIRDFLSDNTNISLQEAMKFWKLKKSMRGSNEYSRTDLQLK
jgi:hypothetical protein